MGEIRIGLSFRCKFKIDFFWMNVSLPDRLESRLVAPHEPLRENDDGIL